MAGRARLRRATLDEPNRSRLLELEGRAEKTSRVKSRDPSAERAPGVTTGRKRGRRPPAPGGRPFSVVVWLSESELAQITGMAAREGLGVSAWLGQAGVRLAARHGTAGESTMRGGSGVQAVMVTYQGLMDVRRILRNIGGNLNDVARHANSTGTLPAETRQVQAMVARRVLQIDPVLAALLEALAAVGVRVARRRS